MTGLEVAISCLAITLFHESRGEPEVGQYAVAMVVINRTHHNYKQTCHEVFKYHQFTWANNAIDENGVLMSSYIPKGKVWRHSWMIAKRALSGEVNDFTGGATHYYADYISPPRWTIGMIALGKYGSQYFFKEDK